ncbi:restriction endonuclease [Amycolatopsis sp. NPDC021455]|uniref:restriction endonuclease n=1 Tax=Amycolatopsis sp. NPDC021455 TaxID=3154901 RepID=UPI00340E971F
MDKPEIVQKPWRDRSNTLGVIPGKSDGQANSLRGVVEQLPLAGGQDVQLTFLGGEVRSVRCDEFFNRQLTRGAIVVRSAKDKWDASPATRYWFDTGDDIFFAKHLHANVKLFGELLAHIRDQPDDYRPLELAQRYNLAWTSLDQIHRRVSWMQALGLLERWGHAKLVVTDNGRKFLDEVDLVLPETVAQNLEPLEDEAADLPEPPPFLAEALDRFGAADLEGRKILIGYIPRGRKGAGRPSDASQSSIFDALRNYLDLVGSGASSDEIFEKAQIAFGQKKSSYTQSMNTLRNMGVVDMVAFNRFGVPPEMSGILQPGSEVDFVRHLHLRYRFVGELLAAMDGSTAASSLVEVAKSQYDLKQIDGAEVRTRLTFMAEAGLVERIDWSRYRVTANGRALAAELALESGRKTAAGSERRERDEVPEASADRALAETIADLRRYGNASDASTQFERALALAFEFLGFRAEHLGGKGQTDVLITVELSPADRYRAIIDAKASASGVISDNAVAFDAIKDHLDRHKADYAAVVGPEFAPRVKSWAANHRITLLTVEELISLLALHRTSPLTLPQLRLLFENPDDPTVIFDSYGAAARSIEVLKRIVDVLYQEANDDDPMAEGYISTENLYFTLRKELTPRPSKAFVDDCLTFLSSSLVRAVQRDDDKYKLIDGPTNIERRLFGLSSSLGSLSLQGNG